MNMVEIIWIKGNGIWKGANTGNRTVYIFESGAFHHETHRFIKYMWQ